MTQQYVDSALQSAIEHHQAGRLAEAETIYRQILLHQPNHADALHLLGVAALQFDRPDEALELISKAIEINPTAAEYQNNLGNVLVRMDRYDQAVAAFGRAVDLRPDYPKALSNLGNALRATGQHEAALVTFRRTLALSPGYSEAHWNLALSLLLLGDFEQGWKEYEWRWQIKAPAPRPFQQPRWDGAELHGKTILIAGEGGFGDAIQFVRYVPMVAKRGGRAILRFQRELRRLMQKLQGVEGFCGLDEPVPPFDVYCPLFTLPLVFETTLETIPADVPYLFGDGSRKLQSGARHVGLVWAGSSEHKNDRNRSIPLRELSALADVPVMLHSLQVADAAAAQIREVPGLKLIDHSSELRDFADTAALIEALDLVITVDTSVAHLAGAMGKPVWVLIPDPPEWRWMLNRDDSPWYPTMRLFRQETLGDWTAPIRRIAAELRSLNSIRA
jgi:Tetratricopeptide repeat/Glycosyltransferase family 9 (heptosyltransferase)